LVPANLDYGFVHITEGILSPSVLCGALTAAVASPWRTIRAITDVLRGGLRGLRDLVALPKGLWLARTAHELGVEHIHSYWLSVPASTAMVASRVSGVPWSTTAHRWDIYGATNLKAKSDAASLVRFISRRGRRDAIERGVDPTKSVVVHLGVAVPPFKDRCSNDGLPELVCVASLIPVKGHRLLLESLARVPPDSRPMLHMIGDGPLGDSLQQLTESLGLLPWVEFHGRLPRAEVLDTYKRISRPVAIMASMELDCHEHEGVPIALVEAMARSVPAIATSTGSIPELMGGLENLVPGDDAEALAHAIRRLCLEPNEYRASAHACWERVNSGWDSEVTASSLVLAVREASACGT
jgi:glycosyltransferase involved in cell wall biosynthesis